MLEDGLLNAFRCSRSINSQRFGLIYSSCHGGITLTSWKLVCGLYPCQNWRPASSKVD